MSTENVMGPSPIGIKPKTKQWGPVAVDVAEGCLGDVFEQLPEAFLLLPTTVGTNRSEHVDTMA